MKAAIAVVAAMFAVAVSAQPAPKAAPKVCDVSYTMESETADGHDVLNSKILVYGLPWVEVADNSKRGMRVIDLASKVQDQGGPYSIELGEVRQCDGGPPERVAANSILVKGVTLAGANKLTRLMIKVTGEITDRYEEKEKKGAKSAWGHDKARKVKRNDLQQKQW